MEDVKEEKYFHYENIGKSAVTTIIGIILMAVSGGTALLSQFVELPQMNIWILGIIFFVGLFLLFAKDKLIDIVYKKSDKI